MNKALCFLFTLLLSTSLYAQEDESKWDVNAEHGPTQRVQFTTTEGTWLNVDISPDGKTLVFDMLGDIY